MKGEEEEEVDEEEEEEEEVGPSAEKFSLNMGQKKTKKKNTEEETKLNFHKKMEMMQ